MSALAWLFGLGALTIAFPFLFHLIRRQPKGQTEFSSLMFLRPSPPRLTRRSRLENWLLLLLRCAAIILIALAFTRPFFRNGPQISMAELPGRNVAILIDTSVSMKRGELWNDAVAASKDILGELRAQDRVALFAFDQSVVPLVDFGEFQSSNSEVIKTRLSQLEPSWHASNLGSAIAGVADRLNQLDDQDQPQTSGQIFLVSDFQKSSNLDALRTLRWPGNIKLQVIPVTSNVSNASVQILRDTSVEESESEVARIRIRNQDQSTIDQYQVRWDTASPTTDAQPAVYVAPGSSHIATLPFPKESVSGVLLQGDECEFDNHFYCVQPEAVIHRVLYIGDHDADDPEQLRYYISRALPESRLSKTVIETELKELAELDLIVVTDEPTAQQSDQIDQFLSSGKMVVFVATKQEHVRDFAKWSGASTDESSRRNEDYHLLADIDFQHPIFAPFDNPRFNDFTRIKFWSHASVQLDQPDQNRVIARFDDDTPAIWERESQGGKVMVFSFGWAPSQSQLALSSKFLPMMHELIKLAVDRPAPINRCNVGDPVALDPKFTNITVINPVGDPVSVEAGKMYRATNLPGIYQVLEGSQPVQQFAVNVAASESDPQAMELEQLEASGVQLGEQETAEETAEQLRTLQDSQLEDRQKVWKWAIAIAFVVLLAETFYAARRSSQPTAPVPMEAA